MTKDSSRWTKGCAYAGVVVAALSWFGMADAAAANPVKGGTFRIALEADLKSGDPLFLTSYNDRQFALSVFDTLFDVDESGKVYGRLAESYQANENATEFNIQLRQGVKFHDGADFNAAAVVANLERSRDPKNKCRCLQSLEPIVSVEATGPYSVRIRTSSPYASLIGVLTEQSGMMISPKQIAEDPEGIANRPIGTGPFKYKEWRKGDQFIAERFDGYWGKTGPYVDTVVFRMINNEESRQATLESGGVDAIQLPAPRFILSSKNNKRLKIWEFAGFGHTFFMLNTSKPPFDDVRVRRAIAHATNRKAILKAIYQDVFPLANTPFGPGLKIDHEETGFPDFSPEKAKALLKEYGKPVEFNYQVYGVPITLLTAQALQQMFADVGVKMNIVQTDQSTLINDALTKNFQAMFFRWSGRADPDLNTYRFFHSDFANQARSSNYVRYESAEMDQLLEAGRSTTDWSKRKPIYQKVADVLGRDVPYVFLMYNTFVIVGSSKVQGVQLVPDGLIRLDTVWLEK
jgi:peptide/nickel transport system substrate-binding protein